ncbi:MAG: class B sortase [Lachnospiraceae bacterium]|nr:class B sortase [Lachnospiraceae bacterium]MDD3794962.1 class B sortase [Lachnospiraceae bacterium]
MRHNRARILPVLFFSLAGMFSIPIAKDALPYIRAGIVTRRLTNLAVEPKPKEKPDVTPLDTQINFEELWKVNQDIIGWICIPGTQVNYAILQSRADDNFYLSHTPEKEENILGAIFIYRKFSPDFTDQNTIIFGHNMRSGQMFGELSNYREEAFWTQHPYVYIYTPQKAMRCLIYSAYTCEVTDKTFIVGYEAASKEYQAFLVYTKEKSVIKTDVIPAAADRIVTLSTCTDGGYASQRFVVNCVPDEIKAIKQ